MFTLSEVNYPALVRETYAIYKIVKKMVVYIKDTKLMLRSEHKSLKYSCFPPPRTPKWRTGGSVEYDSHFEWMPGSQNILVTTCHICYT